MTYLCWVGKAALQHGNLQSSLETCRDFGGLVRAQVHGGAEWMKSLGLRYNTGCWTQEGQAVFLSLTQWQTFCQLSWHFSEVESWSTFPCLSDGGQWAFVKHLEVLEDSVLLDYHNCVIKVSKKSCVCDENFWVQEFHETWAFYSLPCLFFSISQDGTHLYHVSSGSHGEHSS